MDGMISKDLSIYRILLLLMQSHEWAILTPSNLFLFCKGQGGFPARLPSHALNVTLEGKRQHSDGSADDVLLNW